MESELLLANIILTSGRSFTGVVTREEMEKIKKLLQENAPNIELNFQEVKNSPKTVGIPREEVERIEFY